MRKHVSLSHTPDHRKQKSEEYIKRHRTDCKTKNGDRRLQRHKVRLRTVSEIRQKVTIRIQRHDTEPNRRPSRRTADHPHLGDHIYLHKNTSHRFSAGGNSLLPLCHGVAALLLIFPRSLGKTSLRQELTFAAAGLTGICLYYLLENIALTCTSASNVGVIVSAAPFFTGIMTHIFLKEEEKLRGSFFLGFLVAMAGICLISFNGTKRL